jgi:opacity protein-like surface antigen
MRPSTRLVLALAIGIACFLALGPSPAQAQYYYYPAHARVVTLYPKGLYVGGGLVATHILSQSGGDEFLRGGGGFTLHSGFRVNRSLALEAGWTGTLHNPETVRTAFGDDTDYLALHGFTADARIFFRTEHRNMEPFVQGGVGLYLLDSTYFGAQSVGTGFQAGGGVSFALGGHLDLGLRALYRGMAMGPPEGGYRDTYVSALTVDGSLSFRF